MLVLIKASKSLKSCSSVQYNWGGISKDIYFLHDILSVGNVIHKWKCVLQTISQILKEIAFKRSHFKKCQQKNSQN